MKLLFVVNPISGGVDKEPFLRSAEVFCKKYGIDYHIFKTTGKDDDKQLQLTLKQFRPDRVASCGGDGTTLFTATNLLGTDIPMGIIPLGSANGMAVELQVVPKPMDALKDLILSQVVSGLDLILVNDQYYGMHIGDVGLNAQVVAAHAKSTQRGMAVYAKHFVEMAGKAETIHAKLKVAGKEVEVAGLMIAFCNAQKYGTGIPLTIDGNPMDGKFEIVVLEKMDGPSLINAGLSKFDKRFFDHTDSSYYKATEAEVFFDRPRLLQLDGEVIGEFDHITARILPKAIGLITHMDNEFIN